MNFVTIPSSVAQTHLRKYISDFDQSESHPCFPSMKCWRSVRGARKCAFRARSQFCFTLQCKFHFPQKGWWEIPERRARWRSALMAKTAPEKLIIKKVVALPLPRQCLSFAETVPQPTPDLNAKPWALFVADSLVAFLLSLSCADSCRLFICRLSLCRPRPACAFL